MNLLLAYGRDFLAILKVLFFQITMMVLHEKVGWLDFMETKASDSARVTYNKMIIFIFS